MSKNKNHLTIGVEENIREVWVQGKQILKKD